VSVIAREERPKRQAPTVSSAQAAVSIHHVSKTFRLPRERYHTLKERVLHPLRSSQVDLLRAVQDVTVDVAPGEFFGIVGRNGSGKSTLLKCLAGIYRIDEGWLFVQGRLSPFIELGVGFNMDLKARDNVIINSIMLGLTRKQARARFDAIIDFAELRDFTELKLKNYSSGMLVRLAFATAIQVDADVLLIDEVLAVGDAAFQQKCFDEFGRLRAAGRTILFVTHDMTAVQRFCDRAMLLDRGKTVQIADPSTIAREYNRINFADLSAGGGRTATGAGAPKIAEVLNAWFESADGERIVTANQGERCSVCLDVRFADYLEDPVFAITLENEMGHVAFATSTNVHEISTGRFEPASTVTIRVAFDNWLAPGRYGLIATVARAGPGADALDVHTNTSIIVLADRPGGGVVDLPSKIEIARP
jgi:ABC-type polysaccharide/polyol phosphate transport system ATPase subunit